MTNTTTMSPKAPVAVSTDASAVTAPTQFIEHGSLFQWEYPEVFAAELRAAFQPLRSSNQAGQ